MIAEVLKMAQHAKPADDRKSVDEDIKIAYWRRTDKEAASDG